MPRHTIKLVVFAFALTGSGLAQGHENEAMVAGDTAPAAAESADADGPGITGFFRLDSDGQGVLVWAAANHPIGGFSLYSDILVNTASSRVEFDLGATFAFGPVTLLPAVGLQMDFAALDTSSWAFLPLELYTFLTLEPIYFESWIFVTLPSIFADGGLNSFYTRNFLLLMLSSVVSIGPQIEAFIGLNGDDDEVLSLPIGGRINLAYGPSHSLGLFLGYETKKPEGTNGVTGRFTFVWYW